MEWSWNVNDQEKAIARACLCSIVTGIEELRDIPSWWAWLSQKHRDEVKEFQALVLHQLNELE